MIILAYINQSKILIISTWLPDKKADIHLLVTEVECTLLPDVVKHL